MKKVVILGGGIAGLSAAHELVERGFYVELYEAGHIAGGKARSIPVTEGVAEGKKPLPGEHGFRFFPFFYKHLIDTMKRTPYKQNQNGVFDNFVFGSRLQVVALQGRNYDLVPRLPQSFDDFKVMIEAVYGYPEIGITDDDLMFFTTRMWRFATSCLERRMEEYERISWWDFIDAGNRSEAYSTYLAVGCTRTLVAAKAEEASAWTVATILLQLAQDLFTTGGGTDRLLNGPTNDVWIDPWVEYLMKSGVKYNLEARVEKIYCDGDKITGAEVCMNGKTTTVRGDYYISALPVEVLEKLITPEMEQADPRLGYLHQLFESVAWMNGIQYYLTQDVEMSHGHIIYIDSPWALTSVSQIQFWKDYDIENRGDGKVRGIISVDISDWFNAEGTFIGKAAKDCTREEIAKEAWEQMKQSINKDGKEILKDEYLHSWFLDPDIITAHDERVHQAVNVEPLLINKKNTWRLRPDAETNIPNFFLASDYVRTYTNLATMESANEAARRAVNGILQAAKMHGVRRCQLWDLEEPQFLAAWRKNDAKRFKAGLAWNGMPLGFDFVADIRDKYFPSFTLYK